METQNYNNHRRLVPGYHYFLTTVLLLCLVLAIWNGWRAYEHQSGRLAAAAIFGLTVAAITLTLLARVFSLKAQDKAILAQENLRYFTLTGKLIPAALSHAQVAALRFADDAQFPHLVDEALKNNTAPNEIKKQVAHWRADTHRV